MNKFKLLLLLIITSITLSGCIFDTKPAGQIADGGVWKTVDKTLTWQASSLIPTTSGKPGSLMNLDGFLAIDPSDNKGLYFGSDAGGLFYSYDAGANWRVADKLGKITINAIAVDPKNKCVIYVANKNKIHKTTDCSRTWTQIYFDNDTKLTINTLVIDRNNNNILYFGNSRGEVDKSVDAGKSWNVMARFKYANIKKVVIGLFDSNLVMAASLSSGVYKSTNAGKTWTDLSPQLKKFPNSRSFKDLVHSPAQKGFWILASTYGLVKTINDGADWTEIKLLTPEKKAVINSVAISPVNVKDIYYSTNTTLYSTINGGDTWTARKLPTSRAGRQLLFDYSDAKIIYLTTLFIQK